MAETTRSGSMRGKREASMVGKEFYDCDYFHTLSFCPDSEDASTPATQVHHMLKLKGIGAPSAPLVIRFHGTDTLDAMIEALIEHRTFVFGRREWRNDFYEQSPR